MLKSSKQVKITSLFGPGPSKSPKYSENTSTDNDLPDILVFTDSQIDERKGYRAANGTEKVIRGTKTPVEPKALYGQTEW
jgi:hypothetical protein